MSKLFKFQGDESCDCPQCKLVEDYTELLLDADSVEELKYFLSLAIDDAVGLGHRQSLISDIANKMDVLDAMEECDCGGCEECSDVSYCDECDESVERCRCF